MREKSEQQIKDIQSGPSLPKLTAYEIFQINCLPCKASSKTSELRTDQPL